MNHKRSYRILWIGQIGGLLFLLLGYALSQDRDLLETAKIFCILGIVMLLGAVIQAGLFYCCPYCGSHFNIRSRRPDYCPRCGKRIDW